jgi:hypothetical protein
VGDDGGVVESDFAGREGVAGLWQRREIASDLSALPRSSRRKPASTTEPCDEGHEAERDVALAPTEQLEAPRALELQLVDRSPDIDDVVAQGGVGQCLDFLNFEVVNKGL